MKTKNITLVFTIIAFLFTGFNLTLAQNKVNKEKVAVKKHTMMKDSTAMHSAKMMNNKKSKMMNNKKSKMMNNKKSKMMDNKKGKMMDKMDGKMKGDMDCKTMPDSTKVINKSTHESHHPKDKDKDKDE